MIFPSPFFGKAPAVDEISYATPRALVDINITANGAEVFGVLGETSAGEGAFLRFDVTDPDNISLIASVQSSQLDFANGGRSVKNSGFLGGDDAALYVGTPSAMVRVDRVGYGMTNVLSGAYGGYVSVFGTDTENSVKVMFVSTAAGSLMSASLDGGTGALTIFGISYLPNGVYAPYRTGPASAVTGFAPVGGSTNAVAQINSNNTYGRTSLTVGYTNIVEFVQHRFGQVDMLYLIDRGTNTLAYAAIGDLTANWPITNISLSTALPIHACFVQGTNLTIYILHDDSTISVYSATTVSVVPVLVNTIDISAKIPANEPRRIAYSPLGFLVISGLGKLITWKL